MVVIFKELVIRLRIVPEFIFFKNEIGEIPSCLVNLKKLTLIDGWANNISYVYEILSPIKSLQRVELQVNPIKLDEQNLIIDALPQTTFKFSSDCGCR